MQIQPSATRLGASATIGPSTASAGDAGFASLLRTRMPTPEATLAAPAPARATTGAGPAAATPPATPVAPTKTASPPAPAPAPADAATADRTEPPSAPADAAPADTGANAVATPTAPAPATPTAEAALRNQLRARLRAADATTPPTAQSRGDAAAPADPVPPTPADAAEAPRAQRKTDPAAAPDASSVPLPIGTAAPVTPAAAAPALSSDAPADGLAEARTRPAAARDSAATPATSTEPDSRTGTAGPAAETPSAGAAFTALLAEHRAGTPAGEAARGNAVDAGTPTTPGALAFGAAPVPGIAAPQAVAVATPVDAPNFAQHLGVQLSVLAKDGVQHAELHLNPADMGPVSVQITMDGTQARIDFGADVAATRHAIESGLPQLAGALADAGFTLAGGGVSSHAGGRGDGGGGQGQPGSGNGPTRATGIAATEAAAPAVRRVVSMGGLDLYA